MKDLREVITREVKRKNLTNKDFISMIGMTEAGYYRALKTNDLKLSTLDKIGKVLNVEVNKFFIEDENFASQELNKTLHTDLKEWNTKEMKYQQTIKELLSTITNLSLGKRKGVFI